MLYVLKQPPIKSYFSKCLLKGGKNSLRFSAGGGVSSYTRQSWWCGGERCGKEPGGPMTGLLCGLGGWRRAGMLTSREVLPGPGGLGQVLTPAFVRTRPQVGSSVPSRQPHCPSSAAGLGEPQAQLTPGARKVSYPQNLLSLGDENKMFTIRTHLGEPQEI